MSHQEDYIVGPLEDLPLQRALLVQIGGQRIGVYRIGESVRAYENVCPHMGGPVCQGEVVEWVEEVVDPEGLVIEQRVVPGRWHLACPWHGLEFDLSSGKCIADPRLRLRQYPCWVENGVVYIRVTPE